MNGGVNKMSVKSCEKLEKNEVALTIEVGTETFETGIEKAYRQKRKSIRVPGFRPGKAPRHLIEKMYGAEVFYSDAIDQVWESAYEKAVMEEKLRVVGDPRVELVGDVSKDGFTFKATVPVYPEVTLGQYKGLKAPKEEVKVTAADVDDRLKTLSDRNTRLVSVDRAVEKDDIAVIDYKGTENGKSFEGGTAENYNLEIGSGSFIPGFEDQIIGMKAGEEKDIDITFPKDYSPDLAGKAVVFHIKVHEVKQKDVPTLDDEFAKDVSEFDTLKDLKADLKKKITEEREQTAQQDFKENLMKQVADNLVCDVPDAMVERQAIRFLDNFRNQIESQGIPYDQYLKISGSDPRKLFEEAKAPALRQVRLELALNAIIAEEKLEASEEEIEAEYKKMAEQYGSDLESVKKLVDSNIIENQVKADKAIEIVTANAIVTKPEEKKPEEKASDDVAVDEKAEESDNGEKKEPRKAAKKAEEGEKKPAAKKTTRKTPAKKAEDKVE
jgi:trigger factor